MHYPYQSLRLYEYCNEIIGDDFMDDLKERGRTERSQKFLALVSFEVEIHGLRADEANKEIESFGLRCLEEKINEEEDFTQED